MNAIRAFVRAHSTEVGAGLAVLAVVAVAIAGALFAQGIGEQVAGASGQPTPTATASTESSSDETAAPPSEAETLTPSRAPAWSGYQVRDAGGPLHGSSWVRVTVDRLNVREAAGTEAAVAGVALGGDLLKVIGDPVLAEDREWAPVVGDGMLGWIATSDGDDHFVETIATPWLFGSQRRLLGLAAGPGGLMVVGWASDLDTVPYEGSGRRALVFTSADGQAWEAVNDLGGPAAAGVVGDGLYVIGQVPSYLQPNLFRVSTDGRTWSDPGVLPFEPRTGAWGPAGAVLVGADEFGNSVSARIQEDGSSQEAMLGGEAPSDPVVEASDAAYVAFGRGSASTLFVSITGLEWEEVSIPDTDAARHVIRDVELDGSRLMVVIGDFTAGTSVLRLGQLDAGGQVTWEADQLAPFGQATVDSVTAGANAFLATGWDAQLAPRVWRSEDGRAWTDLAVDPTTFGGAIGPEPVYANGRWYAATEAVFASSDGASWEEVFRPSRPEMERPGCPPADEVAAIDLLFLGGLAADCYSDASLTFTAWVPLIDGLGGCCWQMGDPEWLNAAIPPAFLSPGVSDFLGAFGVYPVAGLEGELEMETWVRVTGHFHDPAAQACQLTPRADFPHRLESQAEVIAECERRFVVVGIEPVDGPRS